MRYETSSKEVYVYYLVVHSYPAQRLQIVLRRLFRILYQSRNLFEPTPPTLALISPTLPHHKDLPAILRIPQNLIYQTLTRRNPHALLPQPRQRHRPLLGITTADCILHDIHAMPARQQIQTRLQHADVRLNPHNDTIQLLFVA